MTTPVWSIDTSNIKLTPDGSGGFEISVPLTLNGAHVADIDGTMTPAGGLTIHLRLLSGSVPLTGFQAWQVNA
jgi:hypothetical protein